MPIYSYKCENCDYHFDQFQHFTDDPLTVCPRCNAVALRKVYQPVGIVFKGKGFYATDNRSPSGQQYSHKAEGMAAMVPNRTQRVRLKAPRKNPPKQAQPQPPNRRLFFG